MDRLRQSAQGRRTQRSADRRTADRARADPTEEEGGLVLAHGPYRRCRGGPSAGGAGQRAARGRGLGLRPLAPFSPGHGGEKWSAKRTESQLLGFPNDERP
ncbi:MAG: hypothetical protein EOR84_20415 [Mesorhizobium sp.]|nr:MAG: hypothetical protein EOR84_20415 [Mesorhizobium sp.]